VRERIKLDFADFWPGFVKTDNFFYNLLVQRFDVTIDDEPDFLIFSCYGRTFRRYNCVRIFYSARTAARFLRVRFRVHVRLSRQPGPLPSAALGCSVSAPRFRSSRTSTLWRCLRARAAFARSSCRTPWPHQKPVLREALALQAGSISGGGFRNNVGGPVADKAAFLASRKFNIAFENSSFPGYTTEKLFDPLFVHAVPIYWAILSPLAISTRSASCRATTLPTKTR
jgi:hypothetical protein